MNTKHTTQVDFDGQSALLTALIVELQADKRIRCVERSIGLNNKSEVTCLVFFHKLTNKIYNQFGTELENNGFRTEIMADCVIVSVGKKPYVSAW